MGKIFIKMEDDRYEKFDSETGELTELIHTIAVDQQTWFQLYSNVFCYAIASIKSLVNIKVFSVCLKCSVWDDKNGNVVEIGERFKGTLSEFIQIKPQNLNVALKELVDAGLLNKLGRSYYQIHPQIAFCGNRHKRAELIIRMKESNSNNTTDRDKAINNFENGKQ